MQSLFISLLSKKTHPDYFPLESFQHTQYKKKSCINCPTNTYTILLNLWLIHMVIVFYGSLIYQPISVIHFYYFYVNLCKSFVLVLQIVILKNKQTNKKTRGSSPGHTVVVSPIWLLQTKDQPVITRFYFFNYFRII